MELYCSVTTFLKVLMWKYGKYFCFLNVVIFKSFFTVTLLWADYYNPYLICKANAYREMQISLVNNMVLNLMNVKVKKCIYLVKGSVIMHYRNIKTSFNKKTKAFNHVKPIIVHCIIQYILIIKLSI